MGGFTGAMSFFLPILVITNDGHKVRILILCLLINSKVLIVLFYSHYNNSSVRIVDLEFNMDTVRAFLCRYLQQGDCVIGSVCLLTTLLQMDGNEALWRDPGR